MSSLFTVRLRLAFGATSIVASVLMLAVLTGLVPDANQSIVEGRAQLCESLAVYNSAFIAQNDLKSMEGILDAFAEHNSSIRSIGIRQRSGELIHASVGHESEWTATDRSTSTIDQIRVPLLAGNEVWGFVEVAFEPLVHSGWLGLLEQPWFRLPLGVGAACCVLLWLYLGKTLKMLDPSSAVPSRVREALDGLAESLVVIDHKGVIRFANRVFTQLAGQSRERIIGRSITRLPWLDPDTHRPYASGAEDGYPWSRSQSQGTACIGAMLEFLGSDQAVRTLNVSCSPILGPAGQCRGVMICGDDVTHLEDIKNQLRIAKDLADAASAAKSAFVANMSHEIRTPLNAVLGFADVLRRGMATSRDEEYEYLDLIHRSGRHLLELINNILDLAKIESGHLQLESLSFAPYQVVHDVITVLGERARERGLKLVASYESELPEQIESDPTKFRQIITNLVGNAIKFTEQGSVTVAISAIRNKRVLRVEVRDTGIGMTPEQAAKVFVAFEQADNSTTRRFGGTGLGLSISRQFAEALNGSLTVRSELGRGSTFTFDLPFDAKRQSRWIGSKEVSSFLISSEREVQIAPPQCLKGLRILVADDAEANRRLIGLILTRAGALVTTSVDGRDALDQLILHAFDLAVIDMQMPELDGYQATKSLRASGRTLPVIALTGNAMKGDRQRCLDAGCNDFLAKPVNVDLLVQTAARWAGRGDGVVVIEPEQNLLRSTHKLVQACQAAMPAVRSTLPMDDPEIREIVCEYVPRMRERAQALSNAISRRDWKVASQESHWLKGSAGTTGFNSISELAGQIDELLKTEQQKAAKELCTALMELISLVDVPTDNAASSIS